MNQILPDNIRVDGPHLPHNLFLDNQCTLFSTDFHTTYYMIKKANIPSIYISDASFIYNLYDLCATINGYIHKILSKRHMSLIFHYVFDKICVWYSFKIQLHLAYINVQGVMHIQTICVSPLSAEVNIGNCDVVLANIPCERGSSGMVLISNHLPVLMIV